MKDARPAPLETLEPGLRRVLAPNPSPMTYWGTNTYLLGEGDVAVVDPGPADPAHLEAVLGALGPGERVSAILVTHSHMDHSPLAQALKEATGAPIYAFGPSDAGRSEVMSRLAARGLTGGGEGVDKGFEPDRLLADGAVLDFGGGTVTALWTPGHMANHLSFQFRDTILTGDIVMGWASTMISPPDGDLEAFMTSAKRLATLPARRLFPGHGAPIEAPAERIAWLIAHRLDRERAVLAALSRLGEADVTALTKAVYTDVGPELLPAAARNMLAHLIALVSQGRAQATPELSHTAIFTPA